MMDANQVWGVDEAIVCHARLSPSSTPGGSRSRRARTTSSAMRASAARSSADPRRRPASMSQNRVIFKQLFQAEAIDVCQIDACRVGGVNEVLAIMLMAAKFGVPVCPHAGGVGLCEYVQHLAVFDYVGVSGTPRGPRRRMGRPPARALPSTRPSSRTAATASRTLPATASRCCRESLAEFAFPDGPAWSTAEALAGLGMSTWPRSPARSVAHAGRRPSADRRYRLLQLGAARAPRRARPVLLAPRRRRQLDDAGLPHERNIGNVLSQTAVISVLALGQLLVIVTRGIDLSVGSTSRFRRVVGALVFVHGHSSGVVVSSILATGLASGLSNGARLRAAGGSRTLHRHARDAQHRARARTLGGERHARPRDAGRRPDARRRHHRLASVLVLRRRRPRARRADRTTCLVWGRWLYAVGGNPDAARRAGIPVGRVLVGVYALSGLAAGVGGLITAGLIDAGSPNYGSWRSSTRSRP